MSKDPTINSVAEGSQAADRTATLVARKPRAKPRKPLEAAPTALASDAAVLPPDPPAAEPPANASAPLLLVAGTRSAATDKAGTDTAGANKTGLDKAGLDKAGLDKAGLDKAVAGFRTMTVDLAVPPTAASLRLATAPALALIADDAAAARVWADAAGLPDLAILPVAGVMQSLPLALATRLTAAERDAGQARRASALLRREGEATNRRLRAIERFMYSLGGPRLSQALLWPPAEAMARATAGAQIVQRLPIDSPGITAVDLWMPDANEETGRAVEVAIEDSESHHHALTLDEVSVTRDDGWLRYASEEPLSGDRQDCRLVIRHAPEGTGFGLGLAVPDPFFAVQGTTAKADRVLALRIWRAVAGSTLNAAGSGTAVGRGRAEGSVAKRIMPGDLPRPTMLASPRLAKDHVSTSFWGKEDAVLVHPSATGPVCAMLQRAPLAQVSRLSAVVHAPRRDGPTLSFAIGVAPSGTVTEDDWDEYIGAWTTLPPGGWGEVHSIPVRTPLAGRLCDVLLATSVSGGTGNQYAWALFRAFRAVWKQTA